MLFTSAFKNSGILKKFVVLSLGVHVFVSLAFSTSGGYVFTRPITAGEMVLVALDATTPTAIAANSPTEARQHPSVPTMQSVDDGEPVVVTPVVASTTLTDSITHSLLVDKPESREPDGAQASAVVQSVPEQPVNPFDSAVAVPQVRRVPVIQPPLRTIAEFFPNKIEKLTYRLSMLGMPVGRAVLEAKNENGDLRLSLRVTSNEALSALYPVDDLIESRHVAGNFIISKIRQREGNYRSNRGFTISLRDKKVFWINLQNKRSSNEVMPNSEVLDLLSGLYHLRLQALAVGKSQLLHLYDSDAYAQVPVEILRKERIRFNGQETSALVVCPRLPKDGGIFRRTGDMFFWLSNDENRVPLKVETTIALGRVTAELVAAEIEPGEGAVTTAANRYGLVREIVQ